jgi:hypothetical protein
MNDYEGQQQIKPLKKKMCICAFQFASVQFSSICLHFPQYESQHTSRSRYLILLHITKQCVK